MEDEYPIKEIKIMEGVYLWKPEKKTNNDNKNKYILLYKIYL